MKRLPGKEVFHTLADLVLLAAAAYLASQIAIKVLLRPAVAPPEAIPPAGGKIPPRGAASRPAAAGGREGVEEAVVARNLFGSRIVEARAGTPEAGADSSASPLPLLLLGTVVDGGGGRSMAILEDTEARKQVILFVGDSIRPGVALTSVGRNRVVFNRGDREEVLEKTPERATASASAPPGPRTGGFTPPPVLEGRVRPGDLTIGVRRTGENSFVVDRRDLEGAVGNFSQLAAQLRVIPNFSDGKPDGFKIFNLRPGGLFTQVGLANGDVVRRVNGVEISGPEQALQAFVQLKEASHITIDLTRANRNMTLNFEVR